MTIVRQDLLNLTAGIQQDIRQLEHQLRAVNGKLVQLRAWTAALPMAAEKEKAFVCATCGLAFTTEQRLAEHHVNVHWLVSDEPKTITELVNKSAVSK